MPDNTRRRLLYFAPVGYGGLLNYAQEQANAISAQGVDVTILCPPEFQKRAGDCYQLLPLLAPDRPGESPRSRIHRGFRMIRKVLHNQSILRRTIAEHGYRHVMLVAYAEYFAPLWYKGLLQLAKRGVRFGAVVQEPVRNFVLGPRWWHRLSVACAYRFLQEAFVHDAIQLDTIEPMLQMSTTAVPYGPHRFPAASEFPSAVRGRLQIPDGAPVLLAFGHIRDDKHLEYVIESLKEHTNCYLLIAGARQAASQKPESWYMELANSLGVNNRCRWVIEYVSEQEAANLFQASDLVVLTYSSSFRSASGVLNLAARFQKPCIASSGAGSLRTAVQNYGIGIWVEPDQCSAVIEGIQKWLNEPPTPDWDRYDRENSWEKNAELVIERLFSSGQQY